MKKSITITGALGSGKSTVAKLLAQELGYTHYSTGDAQRQIAQQMGMTTIELNHEADINPEIDEKIDGVFKGLNQSLTPYAIDSRMAWYFMPDSFKVKLEVSPLAAAERIMNDQKRSGEKKYESIDEALKAMSVRRHSEVERFKKTYQVNIEDNSNFDLIIDTTKLSPKEVVQEILKAYR